MKEILYGFYGIRIYLPLSGLSRKWRRFSRRLRNKDGKLLQQVQLPSVSWRRCATQRIVKIWEHNKANGNIRISELGVISAIAANCKEGTNLFEIGTFDGRTSLNLAFSSPPDCKVYTLDLLPEMDTRFSLASGERHMVEKEKPGKRFEKHRISDSSTVAKIHQLFGDSATFDFSPYEKSCSLVFVDGSHAYEYVMSDSYAAMKMIKKGGVIIWHDYGIWEGVTRALEEIEAKGKYGLKNIKGTSLVYWKNE
ncbi:MAG: class I SAM-dependent methyltransferase [Nitrospirae bacterium]|nr:class I SAM-dependent methyltransferase [Nitrospirota bacterium]